MGVVYDCCLFYSDVYRYGGPHLLHIFDRTYYKMVEQEIIDKWHVPLSQSDITLSAAVLAMQGWKLTQSDVPLIIQLVENPKYRLSWLFPGSTTIEAHDCAHIVLGRGVMLKDEAFVIGFTMGSTHRMSTLRSSLFLFCARYLYPIGYKFYEAEAKIFRDGVRLAKIMNCKDFAKFDFTVCASETISEIRNNLGLDVPLLRAYYEYEKVNNKESKECQRLV